MTETAYSTRFKKELDAEQYFQLCSLDGVDVHELARDDVICPVCRVRGASFVSATLGRFQRKAHFRFGKSAHDPLCDFYNDKLSTDVSRCLVRFTRDRTKISAILRQWVCAGIQISVFSQKEMWGMRAWFYQKRTQSELKVTVSWDYINWLWYISTHCRRIPRSFREHILPFHPSHTLIPGFNWRHAIESEFFRIHQDINWRLFEEDIYPQVLDTLQDYVDPERPRKALLDPLVLRDEYRMTNQLCQLILYSYSPLKKLLAGRRISGEEATFRAFSALLLFVSNWDTSLAIEKFSAIINVKSVDDMLAGNFIGLNPFTDFALSDALAKIQERPYSFDEEDFYSIETRMRNEYENYRLSNGSSLPELSERVHNDTPPFDFMKNDT
ncbi:hypothetical protein [Duffyella gerundensis]|uniref:hypothetical protein n=1 Tax=Duffyella gerundensis TaxID=1619313 RepID=UPI003FD40442